MSRAPPSSVETGCIIPENCIVGSIDSTAAAKIAATWLLVNDEINKP